MTLGTKNSDCRSSDIAAYIDGELSPDAEIAFEMHAAACAECHAELNLQKNLLRELDLCLTTGELALPSDFAKTVVANAESRVSGLRSANERVTAVLLSAGLLVSWLIALGPGLSGTLSLLNSLVLKAAVVAASVFHFIFDIALGITIIFRALGTSLLQGSGVATASIAVIVVMSLFFLSRLLLRSYSA